MRDCSLSKIWLFILIGVLVFVPYRAMAQMPWPTTDYPAVVKNVKEVFEEITIIKGKTDSTVSNNKMIMSLGQGGSSKSLLKRKLKTGGANGSDKDDGGVP